jgi:acetylglutamate kinase
VDAVGLSALDGGMVTAELHPDAGHLGEVGRVRSVSTALLDSLLAQGRVPVIASIAALGSRLLNINADDLAAAIAGALGAHDLVLLSDTPGLVLEGEVLRHLSLAGLDEALAHPDVQGGMRPKLEAARAALAAGVARVHIAAWRGPGSLRALLEGRSPATTVHAQESQVVAHG